MTEAQNFESGLIDDQKSGSLEFLKFFDPTTCLLYTSDAADE